MTTEPKKTPKKTAKKKASLVDMQKARSPRTLSTPENDQELLKEVRLERIKPRAKGDIREPKPKAVVDLATSISKEGLLQPIVVDSSIHLLAGKTRLLACKLIKLVKEVEIGEADVDKRKEILSSRISEVMAGAKLANDMLSQVVSLDWRNFEKQHGGTGLIPCRVRAIDSESDPAAALMIEIAENENREDFDPAEVQKAYKRLLDHGYTAPKGRPFPGDKPVMGELERIFGKSKRTIQRILKSEREPSKPSARNRTSAKAQVKAYLDAMAPKVEAEGDAGLAKQMRSLASKIES